MVNHVFLTMLQAAIHLPLGRCDYPRCEQERARKRDGTLHNKCEQHRRQQCEYQKHYVQRKQERSRPRSSGSRPWEESLKVNTEEPLIARALSQPITRQPGPSTHGNANAALPICKYYKCTRVCFLGRDNQFRAKCEFHLYRHRQYQQKVRERSSPRPVSSNQEPRYVDSSYQHTTFSFQKLWDEEGVAGPISPLTMMTLETGSTGGDVLANELSRENVGFDMVASPDQLLRGWGPDVLEEVLKMLERSEKGGDSEGNTEEH